MPELPEVETIKRGLAKYLQGHKVLKVEVRFRKRFEGEEKRLVGGKVIEIKRFGKILSLDFDNGYSCLIHIKLTGQLIYRGPNLKDGSYLSKKIIGGLEGKHTHVIFQFDRGAKLYFNDVRKFGWIKIVKKDELSEISFLKNLGPEPFKDLTFDLFKHILSKSSRQIKIILMDQTKIAGIGNIYANDALWLAGINPKNPASQLTSEHAKELYDSILKVLGDGIKYGGASELSYVTAEGKEGSYQYHTLAYGREGELCSRCQKAKFVKYFLGGRGTYVCPICQK